MTISSIPAFSVPPQIEDLCRHHGVRELAVFGSAARGDMNAGSDVDLLVTFEDDDRVGFRQYEALRESLEQALGRPVDLVTRSGLKWVIRDRVLAESRVIYANR